METTIDNEVIGDFLDSEQIDSMAVYKIWTWNTPYCRCCLLGLLGTNYVLFGHNAEFDSVWEYALCDNCAELILTY